MLSILTTVHFIECLLVHLAFTSNSEERMNLLSILSYLTDYRSMLLYYIRYRINCTIYCKRTSLLRNDFKLKSSE